MVEEGELERSTSGNVYVPSAKEILDDTGLNRTPRLHWGDEAQALAEIGRWIEEEAYDFEDDTNRTGIAQFYTGDTDEQPFDNRTMRRIATAISYRVKARIYEKARGKQPDNESYTELHRNAVAQAKKRTVNLHATSAHPHVEGVYVPDRAPRAIGAAYTGDEAGRPIDDGKDQLLWDTTHEEDDNI